MVLTVRFQVLFQQQETPFALHYRSLSVLPGITCVSGAMLILTHEAQYGENGIVVMGDVAVTP